MTRKRKCEIDEAIMQKARLIKQIKYDENITKNCSVYSRGKTKNQDGKYEMRIY